MNTYRNPSPSYLVLHTAQCRTISADGPGNYTNKDYVKVCADGRYQLRRYVEALGGHLDRCGVCDP